ncbi:hypothetical protein EDB85DRAFT_2153388 [Lactarius pseudohatsudake]|nr:hypothetical protein EDB85DRAFT_2153388 [Lactarius pseudohatsudake]
MQSRRSEVFIQSTSDGVHRAPDQTYNLDILPIHRASRLLSVFRSHQDPARGSTKVCLLNDITVVMSCRKQLFTKQPNSIFARARAQSRRNSPSTARTLAIIYEHMNAAPGTFLRTTFTSISRANVMDAETLRVSFGDRAYSTGQCAPPRFSPEKIARPKEASERLVFVLNKIDPVPGESTRAFSEGFAPHDPNDALPRCRPGTNLSFGTARAISSAFRGAQDRRGAALHCWDSLAAGKTA